MAQRLLITGGSGKVATSLRPRLAAPGRTLRLLDIVAPAPVDGSGDEEVVIASVDDLDALTAAFADVDAIVHLGGQSKESDAEDVLRLNAYGTYCVLEAARRAGVKRVVLASSSHAVGFHERDDSYPDGLPADLPPRPDTLYGWSKTAVESLGRLYVDRFGLDVICLRIGLWFPTPPQLRGLALWLSPDDGARLVEACVAVEHPGYRIVWGVSRNTRRWWSLAEGEAIGYFPKDDAEIFAERYVAEFGEPDFEHDPLLNRVGSYWCDHPLGQRMG
ncbi:NAD-dependent epimerase/dehydratase family protein [Actinoplanes friuliensis]|uniref:NAD-dependent epimerase/dehydratase n=1 Tax=Actinoplanes friuliensis DSM 7358 TaxID=1246995 RepID=U5W660_9ACTN|nr:NAD(P)-dependent oxidoreductase [Actinoplanes friuliensis]AGZ43490.1 NAD-dependent epimerase/dehydratase [Actinoplanes friuliensis DSM 7358]